MKIVSRPRRSWLSFLLSLFLPGLGQVYNGRFFKGLIFYLFYLAVLTGSFLSLRSLPVILISIVGLRLLISIEAALDSRRERIPHRFKFYQRWYIYLLIFCLGAVGGRLIRKSVVGEVEVSGQSMEPAILSGDIALADRITFRFRSPRPGEVVLLKSPLRRGGMLVKRVAAVAGQTIAIEGDSVIVDGKQIHWPPSGFEREGGNETLIEAETKAVPAGTVFVLSDNLSRAPDSRFFGPVAEDFVRSRLLRIFWSWDRNRNRVRWDRIGKSIEHRL